MSNTLRISIDRSVIAGAAVAIAAAAVFTATPVRAQLSQMQSDSVSTEIRALRERGGSDAWDRKVIKILRAAYDKDRSGWIDTREEVTAIPCHVMSTLDRMIQNRTNGRSGLAWTYGFQPDTSGKRYHYLGKLLGFSDGVRTATFSHIKSCGVRTR